MTLITRLQQAEAGSRELSDEFLVAMGWRHCEDKRLPDRSQYGWLAPGAEKACLVLGDPDPTQDMNAVLAMVPEGWTWDVDATAPEAGIDWSLWPPKGGHDSRITGTGNTPALALCIAILQAKGASE